MKRETDFEEKGSMNTLIRKKRRIQKEREDERNTNAKRIDPGTISVES